MPLPLLLIPLAIAGGSALAQVAAKLRAHNRLNRLKEELEQVESRHREEMAYHHDRQVELCQLLGLSEPELPEVLQPPQEQEDTEADLPRWRRILNQRVLRRRRHTVAQGSPHSRFGIIGRHGSSFLAGAIWRTLSGPIMNFARPIIGRVLSFLPRFAAAGGTGGSLAASTGIRFAVGAVSAVGLILGPALAGVAIAKEVKTVNRARRELQATRVHLQRESYRTAAHTRALERRAASASTPARQLEAGVAPHHQ